MKKVYVVLYILIAVLILDSVFSFVFKNMTYVIITSLIALVISVLVLVFSYLYVLKPLKRFQNMTKSSEKLDLVRLSEVDQSANLKMLGLKVGVIFIEIRKKLQELFDRMTRYVLDNSTISRNLSGFSRDFGQMSDSLKNSNASIQNISAAIEELNASIEEISSSSQTLAKSAQELSETSFGISDNASKGESALKNTDEKMNDFKFKVKQISDQAGVLTNYVNVINQAVEIISSISDQTNLLALNAAIEAARAGDAGKGFAVVADEIRKLAEESKNAALKIGDNIKDVVSGIDDISKNISNVNEQLEQILKLNSTTTSTVISILDSVKSMNSPISGIAASSEELSASSQEMTATSKNITDMSTEVNATMSILDSKLSNVSNKLEELVVESQKSIEDTGNVLNSFHQYEIYSNADYAKELVDAIAAHKSWIEKLESALQNEKMVDIEKDARRCKLGITLNYLNPPDEIKDDIKKAEELHANVHAYGAKVLSAIESGNISSARESFNHAKSSADELIKLIEAIAKKLR